VHVLITPTVITDSHLRTGSEWHELVIRAGKLGLGGPAHGSPERWGWSRTITSLLQAQQRHAQQEQALGALSPQQRAIYRRGEL
jgi:hypothetical protein